MKLHKTYSHAEKVAQALFADRHILTVEGELWIDEHRPIDTTLVHDVRTNWPALKSMMAQGSLWLCCSHELHKPYWKFVDGRWYCLACKRLHPEVAREPKMSRSNRRIAV